MERKINCKQNSETKYISDFDFKSLSQNGKFSGYASVFNVIDSYNDIIKPEAFKKTLTGKNAAGEIKLLWQHAPDEPIGVFEIIKEDTIGLYVEGRLLLDVARGKEAYSLIKSGAVSGLSIGYNVKKSSIDRKSSVRNIYEIDLWEISVVTFPANVHSKITFVKGLQGSEEINNKEASALCIALKKAQDSLMFK